MKRVLTIDEIIKDSHDRRIARIFSPHVPYFDHARLTFNIIVKFSSLYLSRQGHDVISENLEDRTRSECGVLLFQTEIETSVIPMTSIPRKENTPVSSIVFLVSL